MPRIDATTPTAPAQSASDQATGADQCVVAWLRRLLLEGEIAASGTFTEVAQRPEISLRRPRKPRQSESASVEPACPAAARN